MGQVNQLDLEDWDHRQRADYKGGEKHTVIRLPCCGASIEIDPGDGTDQYISCSNRLCPKRSRGKPARHLIAWSLRRTTVRSEGPQLEL